MATASAIKHVSVTGKALFYLKLEGNDKIKHINVGESTYKEVLEMDGGGLTILDSGLKEPINLSDESSKVDDKEVVKRGRGNGGADK